MVLQILDIYNTPQLCRRNFWQIPPNTKNVHRFLNLRILFLRKKKGKDETQSSRFSRQALASTTVLRIYAIFNSHIFLRYHNCIDRSKTYLTFNPFVSKVLKIAHSFKFTVIIYLQLLMLFFHIVIIIYLHLSLHLFISAFSKQFA